MPPPNIVLAHGYLGFATLGPLHYFNDVAPILSSAGAQVVPTIVDPTGNLQQRSTQLARQISDRFHGQPVHIIAHSMGGLDARFLIAKGGVNAASLTTLGTPFRGTLAADVAVDLTKLRQINPGHLLAAIGRYEAQLLIHSPLLVARAELGLQQLRTAVINLRGGDYSHLASYLQGVFTLHQAALGELTTEKCRQDFPDNEQDLRGVPSFSYAGEISSDVVGLALTVPAIVLDAAGQENDGVVPLSSAKLLNHKATVPSDHFGLVGWTPPDISNTYRQIYATIAAL